jgi:hypothetical protein
LRYGEKMLTKFYVIYEDKGSDWEMWDFRFATMEDAEKYLYSYWADLDLGQVDYKMDNFQIEEDYI